ncbi:hypothetical protein BJ508DRAFT_312045 [Ascobolus immersus RN42]|uniref:Uncharacterized protein n=1 Tax=Ascobolus immersus RN42 TaxID=1160509 RepID=A0A3N4HNG4_ASCIM|nr:hypothetical protein BJ508DRAFT_312045 [Ascobolus immersus RN42]
MTFLRPEMTYASALKNTPSAEHICSMPLTDRMRIALGPQPPKPKPADLDDDYQWIHFLRKALAKRKASPTKQARKQRRRERVFSRTGNVDMADIEKRMEEAGWEKLDGEEADRVKEGIVMNFSKVDPLDFVWEMDFMWLNCVRTTNGSIFIVDWHFEQFDCIGDTIEAGLTCIEEEYHEDKRRKWCNDILFSRS